MIVKRRFFYGDSRFDAAANSVALTLQALVLLAAFAGVVVVLPALAIYNALARDNWTGVYVLGGVVAFVALTVCVARVSVWMERR